MAKRIMPKVNTLYEKVQFLLKHARRTPEGCLEVVVLKGNNDGYPHISHEGKRLPVARAVLIAGGYNMQGLKACHFCDNPRCINPFHLFAGTNTDNQIDASFKGRLGKGLDHEDAEDIRARRSQGEKARSIAQDYHITPNYVYAIAKHRTHRKTWVTEMYCNILEKGLLQAVAQSSQKAG